MLDDIDYVADPAGPILDGNLGQRWRAEPRFFRARMVGGVIDVERCRRDRSVITAVFEPCVARARGRGLKRAC